MQLPEKMKAAVVDRAGPPQNVHIEEVPVPRLKRGHVIIAVDYASVGGWDASERSGDWGEVQPGTILGADGSGHVAAVDSDVRHIRPGDRVYSFSYHNPDGGFHAEYVSVRGDLVEHVPEHLDQKTAGAIPCVALTAQTGLRALKTKAGETLLVYGASGGVGSLAVWLGANAFGATVVGTARPDAHEYVRRLGAAHAIDRHSATREDDIKRAAPSGFDVALVTAAGEDLAAFLRHLHSDAPFAYPNGVEPEPRSEGHHALAFDGEMSHEALLQLNSAIGSRTIPLRIEGFALDDVVSAHRRIDQGHVVGKIVLQVR
jgi:NADPH2:quinone reductase